MKTCSLLYPLILGACLCHSLQVTAQVKIGNNATNVDPSAVLELEKTNQGLLMTRVALTGASDNTTISTPAHSLLIYNTATAGSGGDAVIPGFYYWDTSISRWKGLLTSSGPSGDVWLDGNNNLLSVNSANQTLPGANNLALGQNAFGDLGDPSDFIIAIGPGACQSETTSGNAYVSVIGVNAAANNSGTQVQAMGLESAMNNTGQNITAAGPYAAYNNAGNDVNAIGQDAAFQNTENNINAFGNGAAAFNSGFEVNALGPGACHENTGQVVNAMGWQSAELNHGNDINAFGVRAAQNNGAAGDLLNAFGLEAGQNNNGGSVNALGEAAARNNTGSLVNALGGFAGENNAAWSANMLGSQSGQFNTGAELNAMGAMSAQYNTHAGVNAFGLTAAQYNHNSDVNALGWRAAQYNTGRDVSALGPDAARFNSGDHTIALGESAVYGDSLITEGPGIIGIGYSAASNASVGPFNICIGYDADIPDPGAANQINIGNTIIRETDGMIRLKDFIRLTPMSSPPATSEEGVIYYSAVTHKLYVNTDTGWKALW